MRRHQTLFMLVVVVLVGFGIGNSAAATSPSRGPYIVVLKPGADQATMATRATALGGAVTARYRYALNGFAATLPSTAVTALQRDSRVLFLSPDREVSIVLPSQVTAGALSTSGAPVSPTCPLSTRSGFPTQCIPPGIDRIEAEQSSARSGDGRGSSDVNVAILDTGTQAAHPDLNVVGGAKCVNDGLSATDDPDTNFSHGTFVGGIVGAMDNGYGVVGVAPAARLWSVRVFRKNGHGTESTFLCGVEWVTSTRMDTDPSNDIAVANLSGGGQVKDADDENCGRANKDAMHLAICNSVSAGVTWVVAAGNESIDIKDASPAAYDEVLTAAAMADYDGIPGALSPVQCSGLAELTDDKYAFFSNFASLGADRSHTIAAPGVCVVSTVSVGFFLPNFDTNYGISTGTSFSSPTVAGTVAQCIASRDCAGMTPAQIVKKIVSDAEAANAADPGYGYAGDPSHDPNPGRYYGFLIRAADY